MRAVWPLWCFMTIAAQDVELRVPLAPLAPMALSILCVGPLWSAVSP